MIRGQGLGPDRISPNVKFRGEVGKVGAGVPVLTPKHSLHRRYFRYDSAAAQLTSNYS